MQKTQYWCGFSALRKSKNEKLFHRKNENCSGEIEAAVEEGGTDDQEAKTEESGGFLFLGFGRVMNPVGADEGGNAACQEAKSYKECDWIFHGVFVDTDRKDTITEGEGIDDG